MACGSFDTTLKFVRVLDADRGGMVEFEFAIGEPDIFVEMIMPRGAFDEFCRANAVTFITENREPGGRDRSPGEWMPRDATRQRFRTP
jgi:phenol/toluene 2-monooxygenase (NADH) P0/A0